MGSTERTTGIRFVSKEIAKQRYNICKECEEMNRLKQCSQCGCFVIAKTRFANSPCPKNKWQ